MGCYSTLAIMDFCEDKSYPSPVMQLRWRIEDLVSRLEDISKRTFKIDKSGIADCQYSNDDLAYALPEDLFCESDIVSAIAIAIHKLSLMEKEAVKSSPIIGVEEERNREIAGQLSFWDDCQFQVPTDHEEILDYAA